MSTIVSLKSSCLAQVNRLHRLHIELFSDQNLVPQCLVFRIETKECFFAAGLEAHLPWPVARFVQGVTVNSIRGDGEFYFAGIPSHKMGPVPQSPRT